MLPSLISCWRTLGSKHGWKWKRNLESGIEGALNGTYSLADVHVAAVLDDDLALLGGRTVGERLDVLVHDVLLADLRPHRSVDALDDDENHEEEKERNCEANREDDERQVDLIRRTRRHLLVLFLCLANGKIVTTFHRFHRWNFSRRC